jgi:hypothetical protein
MLVTIVTVLPFSTIFGALAKVKRAEPAFHVYKTRFLSFLELRNRGGSEPRRKRKGKIEHRDFLFLPLARRAIILREGGKPSFFFFFFPFGWVRRHAIQGKIKCPAPFSFGGLGGGRNFLIGRLRPRKSGQPTNPRHEQGPICPPALFA